MISKKHITKKYSIPDNRTKQSDANGTKSDNTSQLLHQKFGMSRLIGESPSFQTVIKRIQEIATGTNSVLLLGNPGTEKELFARTIYYLSHRKDKPYFAINCNTIPPELLERELFGLTQDSFSRRKSNDKGYVARAKGGTLFLNNIESLSEKVQERLLDILTKKIYQTSSNKKLTDADVRMIAASNINLLDPKVNGYINKKLLHEFSGFIIVIPPLKSRNSDIPLLANHFVEKYSELYNLKRKILSDKALSKLMLYHWPGNTWELEYIIHQTVLESKGTEIKHVDINFKLNFDIQEIDEISFSENKTRLIEKFEREYLARLLIYCEGNINRALNASQLSRRSFYRKIKKYNISFNGL